LQNTAVRLLRGQLRSGAKLRTLFIQPDACGVSRILATLVWLTPSLLPGTGDWRMAGFVTNLACQFTRERRGRTKFLRRTLIVKFMNPRGM
jgi:hypothetical protein